MQRKASAVWQGGLKDGKGSISTDSGVLKQTQYSFSTRGADKAKFDAAVKGAETGCPVSKLFKAEISVNARLES